MELIEYLSCLQEVFLLNKTLRIQAVVLESVIDLGYFPFHFKHKLVTGSSSFYLHLVTLLPFPVNISSECENLFIFCQVEVQK